MALQDLFHNKKKNWFLVLRDKLQNTKMLDDEGMALYLARISQVLVKLDASGDRILDFEPMRTNLKGFTKEWKSFIKEIVTQDKLIDWNKLWDDCI